MLSPDRIPRQFLYNVSLAHIRQQGAPSIIRKGLWSLTVCQYRSSDGRQCAAGPFIRVYDPKMEGEAFSIIAGRTPAAVDNIAAQHANFVGFLQAAHDQSAATILNRTDAGANPTFMAVYERRMDHLAGKFGLHYTPPGQPIDTTRPNDNDHTSVPV
jgi:hypothetical protein